MHLTGKSMTRELGNMEMLYLCLNWLLMRKQNILENKRDILFRLLQGGCHLWEMSQRKRAWSLTEEVNRNYLHVLWESREKIEIVYIRGSKRVRDFLIFTTFPEYRAQKKRSTLSVFSEVIPPFDHLLLAKYTYCMEYLGTKLQRESWILFQINVIEGGKGMK